MFCFFICGSCSAGKGPLYSPVDQRIFPNHLIFVDLEQLVPDLLEEKDLYILLLISEYFLIT
jgi:hypothetical protein